MVNLKLQLLQTVFFMDGLDLSDKLGFASKLIAASDNILDGDPAILPVPGDIPPEIPRIMTKSKDDVYKCNVSLNRIDLFFNPKDEEKRNLLIIDRNYLKIIRGIADLVRMRLDFHIPRLGIVASFLLDLAESSNKYISKRYLKDCSLLSDTHELQLHALNKLSLSDKIEVNRWLRITTLRDREHPEDDKHLKVIVDINSLPENRYDFDKEKIERMLSSALEHMNNLFRDHFGG